MTGTKRRALTCLEVAARHEAAGLDLLGGSCQARSGGP